MARPALALRPGPYGPVPAAPVLALGAVGAVPPGHGRRRRRRDSVHAGSAREEEGEPGELADARSRDQVLPARRAARDLHAVSVPDLPEHKAIFIAYEYAGAVRNIYLKDPGPGAGRFVDGPVGRHVGRRHARRRRRPASTIRRWFDRAGNFHSDELHVVERYTRTGAGRHQLRSDDRGSERLHAAVEDAACRSIAASRRTRS